MPKQKVIPDSAMPKTVFLSPSINRRLKIHAALTQKTEFEIIELALDGYLKQAAEVAAP